jgi:predicted transcriptional regulator
MTAAAVAELLGITQQAVAKAVVRGGELADDQRYKLRSLQTKRGRVVTLPLFVCDLLKASI